MDPRHVEKTFSVIGDPPFDNLGRDIAVAELKEVELDAHVVELPLEILDPESDAGKLAKSGVYIPSMPQPTIHTVRYLVGTKFNNWEFIRAWYYWIVDTKKNPMPFDHALELYNMPGCAILADGDCRDPKPTSPVYCYHIDNHAGLKAFADMLRRIYGD